MTKKGIWTKFEKKDKESFPPCGGFYLVTVEDREGKRYCLPDEWITLNPSSPHWDSEDTVEALGRVIWWANYPAPCMDGSSDQYPQVGERIVIHATAEEVRSNGIIIAKSVTGDYFGTGVGSISREGGE